MISLEEQDEYVENLKSYYGEDFEELSGFVWEIKSGDNPDILTSLSGNISTLLQEFTITCEEVYGIEDSRHYFELMLIDYDLPSLYEFGNE